MFLPALHTDTAPDSEVELLLARARTFIESSKAPATLRAWRSDWASFSAFCKRVDRPALPASPETVALYIAWMAETRKPSTIARHLATIRRAHRSHDLTSPTDDLTVRDTLRGVRRLLGDSPNPKPPLAPHDLIRICAALPRTVRGARDRAVLTVGFSSGARRSELVALDVDDLRVTDDHAALRIRRSKVDQHGRGHELLLPRARNKDVCPVRAISTWLAVADIDDGAVFRPVDRWGNVRPERLQARVVAEILRRTAGAVGAANAETLAAHSLRRGVVSAAIDAGAPAWKVARQSRHASASSGSFRSYVDLDAAAGADAVRSIGL